MALSTSIPMASTNDASDTRCSEPSKTFSIISEPSTVTSRLNPRMTPLRNPMANMRSTTTMRTDSTRFIRNESSAASTFSGWKNTSCISIPAGMRSFSSRSSVRSTWRPILVISVPLSAEMEMPSALRPSYRSSLRTGFSYPSVTEAMSRSRSWSSSCPCSSRLPMSSVVR